ncbi:MAG TPA: tape measure protein [Flavisolibacter sp.]|jgi:tape measure domain-containing protein|nr:tape measure protein [Flavisolibacter sp.]
MAVDITGDGGLFFEAGIDFTKLDADLQKYQDKIAGSLQNVVKEQSKFDAQQQQIAQNILKNAGAYNTYSKSVGDYILNLAGYGTSVKKAGVDVAAGLDAMQKRIQELKGETLEFNTKGLDTASLLSSLETLEKEVDEFKDNKLELRTEKLDVTPILTAIGQVETEYEKLLSKPLKLDVDTSAFKSMPPVFSQASLDAWNQQKQVITEAVQAYKFFYEQGSDSIEGLEAKIKALASHSLDLKVKGADTSALTASLDSLQQQLEKLKSMDLKTGDVDFASLNDAIRSIQEGIAKVSGQTIELRIKDVDTASVIQAFDNLQKKIANLKSAELSVKVGDIDLDSLSQAIQRAKDQFKELQALSVDGSVDLDTTQFQEKYNRLLSEINTLEQQTIQIKAAGLDAEPLQADLAALKEALQAKPLEIPVQVKTGSLSQKTAELDALKKQYADLAEIDRNSDIGKGMVQNIQQLETELENAGKAFLRVEQNAAGSLNEKVATLQKLKDEYAALSEVDRRSTAGKQLAQNIVGLDREVHKINQEFQKTESMAQKAATAIGAYFSLSAGSSFLKDVARVRGEFQELEVAFQTILQSKEKADKLMADVTQLAAATPSGLTQVATAAKQLLAFNTAAEEVPDTLRRLSDISAGIGAPLNEIAEVYGKIRVQGRLFAEDMNQLTGRGIPVIQELAKQFEVTDDQVKSLVESGKVGFPEIERAFQSLTSEGGKFFNLSAESAKTLTGQISALEDAWTRMLNDIGKSNESSFSGVIGAATYVVENYQDVLDILEALIVTYGTYKAAIVASAVVQKLATTEAVRNALAQKGIAVATGSATAAQVLQAGAVNVSRGAWQALNLTMKANPALVVAGVIGTLTFAISKLIKETDAITISMEGYNEELKKERDNLSEMVGKAQALAEGTTERKEAIEAINKAYGGYLPNLLKENASNKDLITTYELLNGKIQENIALKFKNQSVESLNKNFTQSNDELFQGLIDDVRAKKGAAAAGQALAESEKVIDKLIELRRKRDELLSEGKPSASIDRETQRIAGEFYKKFNIQQGFFDNVYGPLVEIASNRVALEKGLKEVDAFFGTYADGAKKTVEKVTKGLQDYLKEKNFGSVFSQALSLAANKTDLDAIKKRLEADKDAINPNLKDTEAKVREVQALINQVDAKLKLYDPNKTDKQNTTAANKAQAEENKLNNILQERIDLIKLIQGLQDDASKVGQSKELSEIDKINHKYDEIIDKVDAYNRKAAIAGVQKIGQAEISSIGNSRNAELSAEVQRQAAEAYQQELEKQRKIFEKFEDYKLKYGTDAAAKLFGEQTKGFTSYIAMLTSELNRLSNDTSDGGRLKKQFLNEELTKAFRDQAQRRFEEETRSFTAVLELTTTFYQKRQAIIAKYDKLEQDLNNNAGNLPSDQYENGLVALKKAKADELRVLEDAATQASAIYERLGRDTINFTRQQLESEISYLGSYLKNSKDLKPDLVIRIAARIENLKGILKDADTATDSLTKLMKEGAKVGDAFNNLGASLSGVNDELADILNSIGGIVSGLVDAAASLKAFKEAKSTDFVGQLSAGLGIAGAAIGIAGTITGFFTKAAEERRRYQIEYQNFLTGIYTGEQQVNALYRERELSQARMNDLRLQGLKEELELLKKQKAEVDKQFTDVLSKLQQERFKGTQQQINDFVNANFSNPSAQKDIDQALYFGLLPLVNKTYKELEALFMQGQLEGKAKELFEVLQKLKQEGVDIEKAERDALRELNEKLTGTTVDALTDSISQMFEQGKTSARDFADFFEKSMADAALSIFKSKEIAERMKGFFDAFSEAATSDGVLSAIEIEELRKKFTGDMNALQDRFKQLQQVTGSSLSFNGVANNNTLKGQFMGMTEDTGNLLAGQLGAQRQTLADSLRVSMQQLNTLNSIQSNTASTLTAIKEQTDKMQHWFTIQGIKLNR